MSKKSETDIRTDVVMKELRENLVYARYLYHGFINGEIHDCKIDGLPDDFNDRASAAATGAVLGVLARSRNSKKIEENLGALYHAIELFHIMMSTEKLMAFGAPLTYDYEILDEYGFPSIRVLGDIETWKKYHNAVVKEVMDGQEE